MRLQAKQPERLQEISEWLRQGQITGAEALRMAMRLRQRRAAAAAAKVDPAEPAPGAEARQAAVRAIMAELDGLIGLQSVKRHVREIQAYLEIQGRRLEQGLPSESTALHMVFTGNPGTGKTTVARILGRLFKAMGILPKGHMVEVERADLVGEYIGHTAQRTREVINRALGGVLFVDEAYSLARGGEKDFGKESIDCLVRALEEHRRELMVILAGYPAEMEWFLSTNPGLRSRFPTIISFPDYTAEELFAIAESMWQVRQYELSPDARAFLRSALRAPEWLAGEEGNARALRNLVERSLRCQALRLVGLANPTKGELMTIVRADLQRAVSERWSGI